MKKEIFKIIAGCLALLLLTAAEYGMWKQGDFVEISLPLNIRLVTANPNIQDNLGKVVWMHGPLVYCFEETDNRNYFDHTTEVCLLTTG